MVNARQQVARDQWDSPAVTESAQDAIRLLGSLEHLFWLFDQNRFVHFAVTALISGETSPRDWRRALDRLQERHPNLVGLHRWRARFDPLVSSGRRHTNSAADCGG